MQKKTTRRKRTPAKSTRTRRRRVTRKRGFLSELVTEKTAQAGIKTAGAGLLGGAAANLLQGVLKPDMPTNMKIFWTGLAAFGAATVGKMPMVGAGMAGVAGYQLLSEVGGMNDNASEYAYAIETAGLPDMLDSYGNPLTLSEADSMYLAQGDPMYLAAADPYADNVEFGYQVPYAPEFGQY